MENNIKNSEDYLKSVLKKSTGFSAPKNYFSEVEEKLSYFIFEEKLPKESGFKTPDTYFDTLENSILDKVTQKKEVKVISLKDRLLKFIPIAAAASVVLFISINLFNNNTTETVNFDNLAQIDIENWIVENATELIIDDFAMILDAEIMNEDDFAFTDLKNDAIEDYIINTDNTSLLNENY